MNVIPVKDLNKCSCRGCEGMVVTIVQKTYGWQRVWFGYCEFHSIVARQYFDDKDDRVVVSLGA